MEIIKKDPTNRSGDRQAGIALYLSVALISMSVLLFEIGLTRMFSVMFEFHYGFLILSLAILGLGVGGIYVHMRVGPVPDADAKPIQNLLPISSGLMAFSILAMTILTVKFSVFQHIFFTALFAFAPFFFAGIFLTVTFRLFSNRSSKVYAADLMGAAAGSVLTIFVLKLGGIDANLLLAALAVLPGNFILFNKRSKKLKKITMLFLLTGFFTIFLLNHLYGFLGEIPFAKGAYKDMDRLLARPESKMRVLESRWSAFGRTDLLVDEEDPDEMIIFVDGGAGSAMYRFDGDPMSLDSSALKDFPGYFIFLSSYYRKRKRRKC